MGVLAVWETPTVPSTALITLILDVCGSTFNTLILSVPIPRISFSLIVGYERSPLTLKWVTIPVAAVVPTPTVLVPIPTNLKWLVGIPTS